MRSHSVLVQDAQQLLSFLAEVDVQSSQHALVQIFSTQSYAAVQSYNALISKNMPLAVTIGHSSRHVIHDGKIHQTGTLVVFSFFSDTHLTAAAVSIERPLQSVKQLVNELRTNDQTQVIISFSQLSHGRERLFYTALGQVVDVPLSGGLATNVGNQSEWLMLNGHIYFDAVVAVALHSSVLKVWRNAFS